MFHVGAVLIVERRISIFRSSCNRHLDQVRIDVALVVHYLLRELLGLGNHLWIVAAVGQRSHNVAANCTPISALARCSLPAQLLGGGRKQLPHPGFELRALRIVQQMIMDEPQPSA